MASTKAYIANDSWVLNERENAIQFFNQEREDLIFPALNQIQWLQEHMSELLESTVL